MSPMLRCLICSCVLLVFAPPAKAAAAATDGRRSAYEPEQAEMRRKKEELERRAADLRAESERRSAEIQRKLAQQRAKNARSSAASTPNENAIERQSPTTAPKVIDIEYDSDSNASGNDATQPKVIEIKGQTEESEGPVVSRPANVAATEPYRDSNHHYTMSLPAGWRAMTDSELSQCNSFARTAAAGLGVQYHGGLRPKTDRPGNPYILFQSKPGTIQSYDELERSLERELPGAVKQVGGALKNWAKDISFGDAAVDRSRNRIVLRMQMDLQGVGKLQAMSVGHIGSKEIVFMHCYAQEKNFATTLPTFEQIIDSFEYDDGYEFATVDASSATDGDGDDAQLDYWNRWLFGGIYGGAGGGVIGVIVLLIRATNRFVLDPGPQYRDT